MRRSLLLPLALLASPALASEPAASPSFYVERDDTDQPAVSRDGDVQLVVWTDRRAGAATVAPELEIGGSETPFSTGATAIATDGHAFLALWNHDVDDETGRALPELRARLLSADATPSGASFRVGDAYDDPAAGRPPPAAMAPCSWSRREKTTCSRSA